MVEFTRFMELGLRVAAMSEKTDGGDRPGISGRACATIESAYSIAPGHLIRVRQVHGARVLTLSALDSSDSINDSTEADGFLTDRRGVPFGVRVADCVPVFLFDPQRRAGGLLHAGRQGTFEGIARHAIDRLQARFSVDVRDLHALIGPSAGPCCYEVSHEMGKAFRDRGLSAHGRLVDLWESNAIQLREAGLPANQIEVFGECTICSGRFHSYRAGETVYRNLAVFMI